MFKQDAKRAEFAMPPGGNRKDRPNDRDFSQIESVRRELSLCKTRLFPHPDLEEWILMLNIELFRNNLAAVTQAHRREVLLCLLAEHEERLLQTGLPDRQAEK